MEGKKKAGILITLSGGICWGISGCFGQFLFVEKNITAEWLVAIRLIFAGVLLIIMGFVIQKEKMWEVFKNKADTKQLLIFSFLGMLMCQYTYFAAIQHSNAGTATVLQFLNPLIILAVVCVKGRRLPGKVELLGIMAALLGTFLLSTRGDIHNMSLTGTALFFGLSSALGAALYSLLSGDLMKKYGVYVVVGYGMLFAGIIMVPFVRPWNYPILWDLGTILGVLGVVVIGTAVAFSLFLKGVSLVGPFMGSLLGSIEPVTAIVVSVLFLGSVFHPVELVGFILILGTVFGLSFYSGKEEKEMIARETEKVYEVD
ncbi:EamA family transporter [Anaerotignum propionicum]|uniref:Inner membrane transporter YicL n=1 Tax=Anaerotignum propionicum DSM 1682 TaxID=991789 RepID=A0A110A6S1_ANAPI|nr:DMT family transporter [Anaerotignum propionicum]AMJ40000.1 putative inner membrane transporter YicL [Anaerotignum propionicum DSM 1682]SHE78310.1 Threonine/homoserine efflux transporter RhtA [[Clostridium] propionicum DSM 1682] [Anaerotignum propionicum DSM 1682]